MINKKYSYGNFTDKTFLDCNPEDFDGEIVGSCFYQQAKDGVVWQEIFPKGITCSFIRCNLDNVIVPDGCKIADGCHLAIQEQNDKQDWICDDKTLEPVEPMDKELRLQAGYSIDPNNIPAEPINEQDRKLMQLQICNPTEFIKNQDEIMTKYNMGVL
jgi:hypothetical protein